ncbi:hypothetical protein HUE57_13100 [Candidatus Reidiella endopervernicosa]|uniref:Pyruvate phosphate dikinase AMP/ATP-binding domain-containing protein n=1 Tax=Candidatus Reidiella endopervernicosa TaxID=2738883 RepID=A0A6N0I135_9GAMM|nr:hypothetical protein HUE57_13100 [Candidatus Reidiella endopervernicosa]
MSEVKIHQWMMRGELPSVLAFYYSDAHKGLETGHGENTDVTVRSSATVEDPPTPHLSG